MTMIGDVSTLLLSRAFLGLILAVLWVRSAIAQPSDRVVLTLDSSEAEAVLAILDKRALHETVTEADWQRVFMSKPFRRLEQHEASVSQPLTNQQFMEFVTTLDASRQPLREVLRQWESLDLQAVAQRPRVYLPPQATIRAEVYPVIDATSGSFVFEPDAPTPAIFLHVEPKTKTREELENTFAHEAHHLGLASVQAAYKQQISSLPENARQAAWWMGNFREGAAVLAAAGSPDVHPMGAFPERIQQEWDREAGHFADDVAELNQFFLDTVHGDLRNDAVAHESRVFLGHGMGPWYTGGYRMAVTIEREFGRPALVATYVDPRQFIARYNEAAISRNAKDGGRLPLFSAEVLKAVAE